jgi:insulysin
MLSESIAIDTMNLSENYRSVMLTAFKYLSLLRSSSFPAWYQQEQVALTTTRFRFTERRRPEDYAVWVAEHMVWPAPPEFYISAPQLVWEWNEDGNEGIGEKEVRELLEGLRVDQGRAVLMARASEQSKLFGTSVQWETEAWYGTTYRVERFDEDFVKQVSRLGFWNRDVHLKLIFPVVGNLSRPKARMTSPNCSYPDPTSSFRPI